MSRPNGSENKVLHVWSIEEKEYLKKVTPGHHYKEIKELINKKFDLNLTQNQIKSAINRYKLNTGLLGRFHKGNIPFNKGMKGICHKGSEKTWFKKGNMPENHRPVGSERININGYVEIKVEEPNKWRLKQQVIYEKHNGKIQSGYAVIFGDGDKNNLDINNLILVSREQLLVLNKHKLIKNNADLTRTGIIIANLHLKISEKKNRRQNKY